MRRATWHLELGTAAAILLVVATIYAAGPQWWNERGVTVSDASTITNDFAPATQGQLKWIATQAAAELAEKLPGGAGPDVAATVAAFTTNDNYAPVAIGQAKAVVAAIYDRLIAVGYTTNYPWTSSTNPPDDFAPLNLGQLKHLFSFDIGTDTDSDGMPDWWEKLHGLDANDATDANLDADGDSVPNLAEFQIGTEPRTADDVRQAGVVLWPQTRSVASGRTLAKEGTLGFTPDVNVVYQRMTVSGGYAWDYFIHEYDEDDNEAVIGQESGWYNGFAMAEFFDTTNCSSLWSVNGFMNTASSYTSNESNTWYTNTTVTWNGPTEWNDVPHGENTGWQVRSCAGDQTVVTCFIPSSSNAASPGECQTNPPTTVSPAPMIPLGNELQVHDDRHAEGFFDTNEPATHVATVLLDRPWRLSNVIAAVRGEVDARVAAVWLEDGWGDPPVKWIHNCPSALSCGYPIAGYEVDITNNTAVAMAGQYRIVMPDSTPGITYRVASIQLMVSHDISVLTQITAYARGTGYAVTSTPVLVECPTNNMCILVVPLGVAGRDTMLCWSRGGSKDLHEFTSKTIVGIGNENLVWTSTRVEGAADYALDSTSGVLTYGSSGGVYRVTVSMHDYPRIYDAFTVTVARVALVPDFNRDGRIDDTDREMLADKGLYRIWKNDDRDIGDDSNEAQDDSPQGSYVSIPNAVSFRAVNCIDGVVNGERDLVDFFPLMLDVPLDAMPPADYSYRLKQQDNAIRFVYTSLDAVNVGMIHTSRVDGCNADGQGDLGNAATYMPESDSAPYPNIASELDGQWLAAGHNVILIEGVFDTTKPLVLQIEKGGSVLFSNELNLSISSVSNMFRYLNIRTNDLFFTDPEPAVLADPVAKLGRWPSRLCEPPNYPDGFFNTNGQPVKTLVAIHGVDWDESETPAGYSEIFKRFFQSGCDARFIGVSWASDVGRRFANPIVYNTDVIGAFVAALYVKTALGDFEGPDTSIFAHSLGNILTSSMISDHGFQAGNYFMINAAVPIESYDGRQDVTNRLLMTPPAWKSDTGGVMTNLYPWPSFAACWHELFTSGDPRTFIRWDDRFAALPTLTSAYDFYSGGEDVLKQPVTGEIPSTGILGAFADLIGIGDDDYEDLVHAEQVWVYNEMKKGDPTWYNALLFLHHNHAGWRIHDFSDPELTPEWAATLSPAMLIQRPIFDDFEGADVRCPTWDDSDDWIYATNGSHLVTEKLPALPFTTESVVATRLAKIKNHAKLLAEAIPALSGPTGGKKLGSLAATNSIDMQTSCRDAALWPMRSDEEKPDRWLHGDYKGPAYLYVHRLYERCTGIIQENAQ